MSKKVEKHKISNAKILMNLLLKGHIKIENNVVIPVSDYAKQYIKTPVQNG